MKFAVAVAAAALVAVPFAAHAATNQEKQVEARFKAADTNRDGKLTKAEAKRGMPRIHENFGRLDTAGRGYITLAQIKAAIAAASN